jgi:hypothetical protein
MNSKQKIIAKALERLSHPGKPAKIKVRTLFEKKFKQYFKPPYSPQPGAKQ